MSWHGFYRAQFHDEAPRIGSGHRVVFVELLGSKYAHLRSPFTLTTARLPISLWNQIRLTARPVSLCPKAIKRVAAAHSSATGQKLTKRDKAMFRAAAH